jgi:anthranilate phosphoribosyltransferase
MTMNEDKVYTPKALGMEPVQPSDLEAGASVADSADIFMAILEGNGSKAQNNIVAANAAFGLKCYYPEKTIRECVAMARESLESGKALNAFKTLISLQ